ncbi:serine/threonine-protein kinase haspin-like [Amblyomma americanum]
MIWILAVVGAFVLVLLGQLCGYGVGGLLEAWRPLSLGWSATNASIADVPKEVSVTHLSVYAALAAPIVLFLATYSLLQRRRLSADSIPKDAKEVPKAHGLELGPGAQNHLGDSSAAVGDMVSTASSSSGFDERLNGDAGDYTPVAGTVQGSPFEAASRASINISGRSTPTTPATPKTSSTSLTRPPEVPRIGALGVSSGLHSLSNRLHSASSGADLFGELLPACHQRSPVKFAQLFNNIEGDRFKIISESQNSEVFRVFSYKGDSVLKVQQLDSTPGSLDNLLSKIKIASRLTELRKMQGYSTSGFLELRSITCLFDAYPEELLAARKNTTSPARLERQVCQGKAEGAYLAWHMSYAGAPLDQIELESVLQLWSVLQQVTLSLVVAEEALEFEHRALRLGHVLVKKTPGKSSHFSVGGRSFAVNTWGVEAHVASYSSSRITDARAPSSRPAVTEHAQIAL